MSSGVMRFAPLTTLVALLALATPARAAGEAFVLKVDRLRGEGIPAKHGRFTWIPVDLENTGSAPIEGTLRAFFGKGAGPGERSPIATERRVSVAPHSKRRERLLYFCRESSGTAVVGFYLDDRAEPIAKEVVDVKASEHTFDVLVLSRDDRAVPLVRAALVGGVRRRDVVAAPLAIEDVPDRPEALASVDGILIADVDLHALTPAQGEALAGFVEQGGQLVLCFGGNCLENKGSPIEPLLPIDEPSSAETRPLDALAAFADAVPSAIAGRGLVALAKPAPGATVVLEEDGIPIILRRRAGKGFVTYLALDPTRPPVLGSGLGSAIAARLFGSRDPPAEGAFGKALAPAEDFFTASRRVIGALDPPPFTVIGALLGLYILFVVPVNYAFWRRRGRLERTAPTAVLLGVLAGGAVYGTGVAFKGTRGFHSELVVLEGSAGEARGLETASVDLFSAERRITRLDSRLAVAPAALREGEPFERMGSERAATIAPPSAGEHPRFALETLELDQWAPRPIVAAGPAEVPIVRADLVLQAQQTVDPQGTPRRLAAAVVHGTIEAPGDLALRSAFLIVGRRVARVGDIARGEAHRFASPLVKPSERSEWTQVDGVPLTSEQLRALMDRRPGLLAGEDDLDGLLVATVDADGDPVVTPGFDAPRTEAKRMLLLSVRVGIEDGLIEIPRGIVRPRVISEAKGKVEAEETGAPGVSSLGFTPSDETLYRFDGAALAIEFTLPVRARLRPDLIEISLRLHDDAPQLVVTGERLTPAGRVFTKLAVEGGRERKGDVGSGTVRVEGAELVVDQASGTSRGGAAALYDPTTGTIRIELEPGNNPVTFFEPEIMVRGELKPRSPR